MFLIMCVAGPDEGFILMDQGPHNYKLKLF